MADTRSTVAIIQYSSSRDGSAWSGLLLADGLRDAGFGTCVIFGHDGPMVAEYRTSGHYVHVCHHLSWLRHADLARFTRDLIVEWKNASGVALQLADCGADVVYINTSVSLAGLIAARRLDLPVIWHLRELFADVGGEMKVPYVLKSFVRRVFVQFASSVVAPSRIIAQDMLGRNADLAQIVPNAAGAEYFDCELSPAEARDRLGLPANRTIIGLPGMLRPMKGHSFFFRAIAPLLQERAELTVAVTGSGKDRYESRLRAELAGLGIADNILFLGVIDDMPALYRSCDMTVVPSRNEPFGRTVIESMATGCPVVASRVGGIPEIIRHEETGLLFEFGDEEALRSCVKRLLDDPVSAATVVDQARARALTEYHESSYKRRIAGLVLEALESAS
ncbi:MAG: glycosyltransferase family 4 protein [Rhodothermales bacterium]|nr:glycosyltransferase family 4 protein [Rhodothermales bacterium]